MASKVGKKEQIRGLLLLALNPTESGPAVGYVARLSEGERAELVKLADSHHVTIRALGPVWQWAARIGNTELAEWATSIIAVERDRISNALQHLEAICGALEASGCPTTVIKTLDHWPDFGNDLDLYTTGDRDAVAEVFMNQFQATVKPQSLGDRLSHKEHFLVPGLDLEIEMHVKRLGQTGEHTQLARRFVKRRRALQVNGYSFYVPAPEERVIAGALQRMYRHLYFRVCDIVNTAALVEAKVIDYGELRSAAMAGGIWPGVATFLRIASDYVKEYKGSALDLPPEVLAAARFGGDRLFFRSRVLKVPAVPEAVTLFTRQLADAAMRGDLPAALRLSLLPPLASAAFVAVKVNGSTEGIW